MQVNILYRPAHTLAQVWLAPGEQLLAEPGAMVGMSPNMRMTTQSGGLMKGLSRMMFGGESFFRNTFTPEGANGEVLLAHALCGDIAVLEMTPAGFAVQSTSFIASSSAVDVSSKAGLKTLFAGEGLFSLRATTQMPGQTLIVGAFGGIQEMVCDGNLVIDTGHLVAWDANLEYQVGKSGTGWVSSFLSGEGLVCHFKGQGRVWIQTRNPAEYGRAIAPQLPVRRQ